MKMKNLLIIIGLSAFLSFHGINYSKAQKIYNPVENSSNYEHVRVKLADDIDKYIIISRNRSHIRILADYLGIKPIISNRKIF